MLSLCIVYDFAAFVSNVAADASCIISTCKVNIDKATIAASRTNSMRLGGQIFACWGGTALKSFTIEAHYDRALGVGSISTLSLAPRHVKLDTSLSITSEDSSHFPFV